MKPIARYPLYNPDIPLELHSLYAEFEWHRKSCRIVCQRTFPGGHTPHPETFYLVDPDGLYHEISFRECRRQLEHPPRTNTPAALAAAWERESQQHDADRFLQLLHLCRP